MTDPDREGRAELTEAIGRICDAGTERDTRELYDICKRLCSLIESVGAFGMRIEVSADGRLRADMFDGSGYSVSRGTGDVHRENSAPIDLLDMKNQARARHDRKMDPR